MNPVLFLRQSLLHLCFPAHCQSCGCALLPQSRAPMPRNLCQDCLGNLCRQAQQPRFLVEGLEGRALLWYEDEAARLVRLIKEGGHSGLLRCLAAQWANFPLDGEAHFLLVPVPTHAHRRRERGGDPVEDLCALWSKAWKLKWRRLLRRRAGRHQRGLGAGERRRNLDGQYVLRGHIRLQDLPPLVLVDDVVTTGATLQLCRQVLESAGGQVVGALTLACAPNPLLRLEALDSLDMEEMKD